MTDFFGPWCGLPKDEAIGKHTSRVLVSSDDGTGIDAVVTIRPSTYAERENLRKIAERYGKKARWQPVHRPLRASRHSRTPSPSTGPCATWGSAGDVTRLGGDQPRTGAVALGHPLRCALVAAGADPLDGFGFGFDQVLHHHPDRLTDEIDAVTGVERLEQLGQADWDKAIGDYASVR